MEDTKRKAGKIFHLLKANSSIGNQEYSGKLNDPGSASTQEIKEHYLNIRPKLKGTFIPTAFKPARQKTERRVNHGRRKTDRQDLN